MPVTTPLEQHHVPKGFSDRLAYAFTRCLRFFADTFFARRYGHRAVVLETVAAIPGMVGGALQHLRSLRRMEGDRGWIHTLLEEAENERMHLMTFMHIARPSAFERLLVLLAQGIFYNSFFLLYLLSPRTAHRVTGYFEEEAIQSYTEYLAEVDTGTTPNVPAPGSPSTTGSLRRTRVCGTSSSRSARMRSITATSIIALPTSWLDGVVRRENAANPSPSSESAAQTLRAGRAGANLAKRCCRGRTG